METHIEIQFLLTIVLLHFANSTEPIKCGYLDWTAFDGLAKLVSYNYLDPVMQPLDCIYKIHANEPSKVVHIKFNRLSIKYSPDCENNYLKMWDGEMSENNVMFIKCGNENPGEFYSSKRIMTLQYKREFQNTGEGFDCYLQQATPKTETGCGNTAFVANVQEQTLKSEGQGNYIAYPIDCLYVIQCVVPNMVLNLTFDKFSIEDSSNCANGFVKIWDGLQMDEELVSYKCGDDSPGTVISTTELLIVQYSVKKQAFKGGFNATFVQINRPTKAECGPLAFSATSETAVFRSFGYGNRINYPIDCTYKITATDEKMAISLTFDQFAIQQTDSCILSYVNIYNGDEQDNNLLKTSCGTQSPGELKSTGPSVIIKYKAELQPLSGGFTVYFKEVKGNPIPCEQNLTVDAGMTENIDMYDGSPLFRRGQICLIRIETSVGYQLQLAFEIFEFQGNNGSCGDADYLQIGNGLELQSDAAKMCGQIAPDNFLSSNNAMFINYIATDIQHSKGFRATVKSVQKTSIPCNQRVIVSSWATEHINVYEGDPLFHRAETCLIQIETSAGYYLNLTFSKFEFQGTNGSCSDTDYLQIGNGLELQPDSAKLCGIKSPDPYVSSKRAIFINYIATDTQITKGFRATVESDFIRLSYADSTRYSSYLIVIPAIYLVKNI